MREIVRDNVFRFPAKKPLVEKSPIVKLGDPKTSPIPPVLVGDVLIAACNLRTAGGNKEEVAMLKQLSDYMWTNCLGYWVFSQEDWDRISPKAQENLKKVT